MINLVWGVLNVPNPLYESHYLEGDEYNYLPIIIVTNSLCQLQRTSAALIQHEGERPFLFAASHQDWGCSQGDNNILTLHTWRKT